MGAKRELADQTLLRREPHEPTSSRPDPVALLSLPPAQTAGALRWQKLARYAAERGFGLDVLTLDPAALTLRDSSALEELPASVRVYAVAEHPSALERTERIGSRWLRALRGMAPASPTSGPVQGGAARARSPSSVARSELRFELTSLRGWSRVYQGVAAPTKEKAWALRAAALGRQIFVAGEHRAVVSCGPPHMTHEGARRLARACGLPLVLDFRDVWSLAERVLEFAASPTFVHLAARYEARAVAQADLIVMNTDLAKRAMQEAYPDAADRVIAVLNGCDEGTVARTYAPGDPFRIAYAGSIYLDRSPSTLFRALARVVDGLSLAPGQIEVAFMGAVSQIDGQSLESHAAAAGVQAYVRSLPLGTRREAERFLASAHVLVNLYQDSRMAIPSKIFEYMRHEAALLVLAEPDSAPYELVRDTDAALAAPDDVDAIAAAIRKQYEKHRAGGKISAIATDPHFSRRRQAERLLNALDVVCEAATAHAGHRR